MPSPAPAERISLQQHISYICSRLLAYALPLIFFLVTVSFYLKTYDSAQIKITFTQIGTTALLGIWIVRMLADGKFPFDRTDLVWVTPFVAFLLSGVIAWFHSPFKVWSMEETWRRIFYMGIAFVTIAEMRGHERTTRLWRWLLAAAIVTVGYGFIQYIDGRFFPIEQGLDPFVWRRAFSVRVFSTFGNPNFYGNFLVIATPLIIASVLRSKGPLLRPFILLVITLFLVVVIDKLRLGSFGGFDPSYEILVGGLILVLLALFGYFALAGTGSSGGLPVSLILFSLLFVSLYATETKGAWLGYTTALAVTMWLVFEYFLHFDEHMVPGRKYAVFLTVLGVALAGLVGFMVAAFIIPAVRGTVDTLGFQLLPIPTVAAGIVSVVMMILLFRRPWNLKKVIYGGLMFFVLFMGAMVLQYAKNRLHSVSFRMFTWIGTWEMIQTQPVLGNGVGTFKIIYPAFRRPEIIVLEGRSNTETDHAEDEYLEIWQDEGIVGFGIFLWMVITVLVVGLKQLRWFSRLRTGDGSRPRRILDVESDPRSYEVMGYLGAYLGALIHWCVDVSVRFVSSGIFSGLLPAAIISQARTLGKPAVAEPKLSYDGWIRLSVAVFWTAVMLWLKLELVPQALIANGDTSLFQIVFWTLLAGAFIWILLVALDRGNGPAPEEPGAAFSAVYPPSSTGFAPVRVVLAVAAIGGTLVLMHTFRNHFMADASHNMGIFFSKEGVWNKSPLFDQKMAGFPADIRKHYDDVGGALEHYDDVVKRNHAFPMAHYFTGNVYNDWGSQEEMAALTARQKGDVAEAQRRHAKAEELWSRAELAYQKTKNLAPNYVQTHYQLGLLDMKRADSAQQWGDTALAQKLFDKALADFMLYRMLDPVFIPNYDRIAQLLLAKGRFDEAIDLYKQSLHYNDKVAELIHKKPFDDRVAALSISIAKVYFNKAQQSGKDPFSPPSPDIVEAIRYFERATASDPNGVEAWKGLAFLYGRTGQREKADAAMARVRQLAPNDPSLQMKPITPKAEE